MKPTRRTRTLVLTFVCLAAGLYAYAGQQQTSGERSATPAQPQQAQAPFDEAKALQDLQKQIAGRENEPAEKVFKNIQVLKGVPAGRIPVIMEKGFSDSLGVTCTFCHNPADFSADPNHHKPIARQMWTMTREINNRLLPAVTELEEKAQVNCTTCHRGQKKPALTLGPPPQPQPSPSR